MIDNRPRSTPGSKKSNTTARPYADTNQRTRFSRKPAFHANRHGTPGTPGVVAVGNSPDHHVVAHAGSPFALCSRRSPERTLDPVPIRIGRSRTVRFGSGL